MTNGSFVGSRACAECHAKIAETYLASGMGNSLRRIDPDSISLDDNSNGFSPDGRHHYSVEATSEGVFHHERQTDESGLEIYDQRARVDSVIGSGNQGQSFIIERDGRLFLSPIGWYSRARRWDLSPGYQLPSHPRFERVVTEGCLECHCGQMNAAPGLQNQFKQPAFIEESIGCERCHGPGAEHIRFRKDPSSSAVDPIVNPKRLDPARREDVCNQCHLQGEGRYPHAGRRFGDFRAGQRLEEVYSILVQGTRATSDGRTQAVSQVEQIQSSACFEKSEGRFGCVSCHDPHFQPPRATLGLYYRDKCLACHSDRGCQTPEAERRLAQPDDSCIACHMPALKTTDVPHTSQTDHRVLRKPVESATPGSSAFEEIPDLFDHAEQRLPQVGVNRARGLWMIDKAESRRDPELASRAIRWLTAVARENPRDAEVQHALGTAASLEGRSEDALTHWKQALSVEPQRELTLQNMAVQLQSLGRFTAARPYFEQSLKVQPWNALMWLRYSRLLGQLGETGPAIAAARKSMEQDPSHAATHKWLADLYAQTGDHDARRRALETLARLTPKPTPD